MKRFLLLGILCIATLSWALQAQPQYGTLDFVARGTPSSGITEPVRGFPVVLLSKSFTDIRKEADAAYPAPDMDAFIDKLDVSKELQAWMKKHKTVSLSGEDFLHMIKPPDIIDVPEFYKAYMDHNADDQSLSTFPKPKYKASEAKKNPAKYAKLEQEFQDSIRHFVAENPQTIDGMDAELTSADPGPKWRDMVAKRAPQIERLTLDLAQSKYMVARAETDLQGGGQIRNLAPGQYWLSSLNVRATVGDAWLRWDQPVQIIAGKTTNVELTNSNSLSPVPETP